MRPDMAKVTTERPRSGGRIKAPKGERKTFADTDWEDQPKREKIRQKWKRGWEGKNFTDVLGPLRGFVLKAVGRPFSKVYAEVKQAMPGGGISASHILDHLWQMLLRENEVFIGEDKKAYFKPQRRRSWHDNGPIPVTAMGKYWAIAYVNPETGIICKSPTETRRYRWKPAGPRFEPRWLTATLALCKVEGIWYAVTFKTVPVAGVFPLYADRVLGNVTASTLRDAYGKFVQAETKLQLNKAELRRYGLKNEPVSED